MSTSKFFNVKKKNLSVDFLDPKCEFSFLECARQILTSAIYLKTRIQFFMFMLFFSFLSVIYVFLYKMDSPLQTNSRSSQVSFFTRKAQSRFTANLIFDTQLIFFV